MNSYKGHQKIVFFIFLFLVFANVFCFFVVCDFLQNRFLKVIFFDIGQGDAIFIETPQRYQILIDAGPNEKIIEKLEKEMPFYDRTIDLVVLSHPEHDHYAGLIPVLEKYEVKNILWTGVVRDNQEWKKWKQALEKEQANIAIGFSGKRIIVQKQPLIYADILYPFENLENKNFKNSNNTSLVLHLFFGKTSFLFTGDIEKKIEKEIVKKEDIDLKADVLKVAHHGSKTSSSEEFLESVFPKLAIIQSGKNNRYGHPHYEVLARLAKFGIEVLRTDEKGDIKIISDGRRIKK